MTKRRLKTPKSIENTVVNTYKGIEDSVLETYKSIEDGFVGAYKKIEIKFVDTFLEEDLSAGAESQGGDDIMPSANPEKN